jgi:hypothetical protein
VSSNLADLKPVLMLAEGPESGPGIGDSSSVPRRISRVTRACDFCRRRRGTSVASQLNAGISTDSGEQPNVDHPR